MQQSVPLVPDDEESCCARLMARADVPAQDEAREWLTFLRALGLVAEGERGFHRLRHDPDRGDLAAAFRERVFGADEVLDVLRAADRPFDADAVFERFEARELVPEWERRRDADWRAVWRERTRRLVEWAVLFGLAERTAEGYARAEESVR